MLGGFVLAALALAGPGTGALAADVVGSNPTAPGNNPVIDKWYGWFEMGGYYGSGRTSAGEATIFAPIAQTPDSLFFLDLKGKFFEQDNQEGNFAVGYRRMTGSGFNLGGWVGADVRSTSIDNTFWQIAGGIEALSHNYDFRANAYLPITGPQAGGPGVTQVLLQGNSIFMIGGREVALYGVDAEAGMRLPLEKLSESLSAVELRAYGGGYYFDSDDASREVAGGKARLELRMPDIFEALPGSQLTAGYQFTYDDVRDARHQVGLKLRIPFGNVADATEDPDESFRLASLNPQEQRMLDGLERDTDIVTGQSGRENVIDDATDVALNQVAYANDLASLQSAIGQGANTHILVEDGGSPIDVTSSQGLLLRSSQTIQGGGSTIMLRGANSGTVSGFTAPGSRPTLAAAGGVRSVLKVPDGSSGIHVAGLRIDGSGADHIVVNPQFEPMNDVRRFVFEQNDVGGSSLSSIDFGNNNQRISILDNQFASRRYGINFLSNNSDIDISGNVFDGGNVTLWFEAHNDRVVINDNTFQGTDAGIYSASWSSNFAVTNNRFLDLTYSAIRFFGDGSGQTGNSVQNLVVAGNRFERIGGPHDGPQDGIHIGHFGKNILVSNNSFQHIGDDAVFISQYNSGVTVDNNVFRSITRDAIEFEDFNTNVIVSNNDIQHVGDDAIQFHDNNTSVTVSNNNIMFVAEDGIWFDDDNTNVTVSNNDILFAGEEGIQFDNGNTNVRIVGNTVGVTVLDAVRIDNRNDGFTIANNVIKGAPYGIWIGDSFSSTRGPNSNIFVTGNQMSYVLNGVTIDEVTNGLLLSGNIGTGMLFSQFSFGFGSPGTTLLAGSSGNVLTDGLGRARLCSQSQPNSFTGTLNVTDLGGLQTFVDGCN
ncbi:MAG: right-handed parallel beta-helix repeat-containing protein [Alphaproteobacteria bacterium]|nr:right-handed parallel beta-helix repeat-containing protein [Alphaproteobacteria bacterium]